ncbi:MAG: hypothetical protein ACYC2H_01220 [Thermoplasmatota archaeon]
MIDLGTVRPGSTIRVPFSSFDKDDGSSITMTNYVVGDILIYKDGGTTERASTTGFTATTDFDAKTGKHVAVIDLASNATAGFFAAGSEYLVAIDAVTVDGVTVGAWIARFRIGYPNATLDTTLASVASQTSMVLTAGPAENDALVGMWAIIHDVASAVQWARVLITAYVGSSRTITLAAAPTFTVAATDNISIMGLAPLQATVLGRTLDVSAGGEAGVDWGNVGSPTTTVGLSGTTVATLTNAPADSSGVTTLLSRLSSARAGYLDNLSAGAVALASTLATLAGKFTGITSVTEWLGLIAGKQTGNGTARTELRATGAGSGTFDETTDSQEALRDNMGTAQTGDVYAIANSGTHGNAALKTILDAIAGYVDTEVGAIKTVTDRLDGMLELDGSVYRFTVNALEQGPSGGGGGSTDWTADQRTALAAILGIPASGTTPDDPTTGILDTIRDLVAAVKTATDNLPTDPADASDIASSFSSLASTLSTIAGYVDTEVGAIKAKTDNLPANPAAASDVPTAAANASAVRSELTAELGRLDAAVSTRATPAQVNTEVVDALVTDVIADSVPADGSRGSIAQGIYMILQFLFERDVAGTTLTVKKPDGSTSLMTFTLGDATSPTSITRST